MPVLVNRETGAAENLGNEAAQAAISSGSHDVPLNDPEGNPVTAPYDQAADLLQQGYTQPSSEHLQNLLDYTKFSTPTEQAKTALEGAASSSSFGLSTAAERALGVNPEDINKRREINPLSHIAGEVAGLAGSSVTGVGEAAALGKIAHGVTEHVAEKLGASALGRIGSTAAGFAAENVLFQSGDEASKLFASDPNQSMETAASDIGLAGLFGMGAGAAFKGAGELWKYGPGKQLGDMMTAVSNKAQGLPSDLKLAAGIDVAPEMEAALSSNPEARQAFQVLQESTTKSGVKAQEALQAFNDNVKGGVATALGKSPEDIEALGNMSKAETGKAFQESLAKTIEEKIKPITSKYDEFEAKFGNAPIEPAQKIEMENNISKMISDQGLAKGPNEEGLSLAQKVLGQLKNQESANDLRKYMQNLSSAAPFGSEKYAVGKDLRQILSDGLDNTIGQHAGADFAQTQQQYAQFKGLLSDLNDRLHLGREGERGAGSFISNLREMDPESVASRMSLKNDSNLQALLDQHFPEAGQLARNQELNNVVKASLDKEGSAIDPKKLFAKLDKLEPELKNYILSAESQQQLGALQKLVQQVPLRMNPSGTAKTLSKLWERMPESATALAAMMTGHNPLAGYIVGKAANWVGREAPDAARLAMLKYLGGKGAVSPEGFKAATHVAGAILHGEQKLEKAVESIYGHSTVRALEFPADKVLDKLAEHLDKVAENPEEQLQENHMGAYVPEHATAVGMITARATNYLQSLKPSTQPDAPLDPPKELSVTEKSAYKQALAIAQQPLVVLNSVKDGSLTQQELTHLQNLYPSLYQRMQQKLMNGLIEHKANEGALSYKTKMGLSMFMGQPLDSSMKPASIMASQPQPVAPQQPQQAKKPSATALNHLNKLPAQFSTSTQANEQRRQSNK